MNASLSTTRGPQHAFEVAVRRAGHTRITARALTRAIEAITADAFGVPPGTVTVNLRDVQGHLGITAGVPLSVPSLPDGSVPGNPESGIYARASRARKEIIRQTGLLTGTAVERVDIRVTGIRQGPEARVR